MIRSGLIGSAICIYTVDQLENIFKTSFLTQRSNESYWLPSPIKFETEKVNIKNKFISQISSRLLV
jgi:hypothetical protein